MYKTVTAKLLSVIILCTACSIDSTKAHVLFQKGMHSYMKKDLAGAADLFRRSLEKDSTQLHVTFMLGKTLYYQKQYKESLQHFNRISNIDPGHSDARYWIARIQALHLGKETTALRNLNRLINRNSHHVRALRLRALLFEKKKLYARALRDYRTLRSMEGGIFAARSNCALLYRRLGLRERARKETQSAVKLYKAAGLRHGRFKAILNQSDR